MYNLIDNRQIRVFISSTFQDMQDERDYLMKRTFPKLRKLAAERDVTLTELDLRWGITEEESKSGKVVEICLREIENSIPFFIGIIGNRYGWVPKKEDLGGNVTERFSEVNSYIDQHLSVTEMEMQFGVLNRDEDMHAYFYIKEQEENTDNPEMLNCLKEAVRKSKYPSTTYNSPEDLARQVEEAFIALLDDLFPNGHLSELEKVRIGQRSFMNQLCQNYIRDEKNFKALDAWLADADSHQFVLTGKSGLGKSALIANWVKEKLSEDTRNYNIIYHFTGNGGSESDSEHITKCLAEEIKNQYGWTDNELGEATKLNELFLRVSSENKKQLLIVIDAINQIVDIDNAKLLNWLPIPGKNIKILFSTLEDDRTMGVFKNRNYPIYTLEALDETRRSELVRSYLKLYAKTLTDAQVSRIVTDTQCENTLVLKTLLDELINFGVFEKLDERIEYYLAQDTIDDFYQALLASYEEDYGNLFIRNILSLIYVSKHGLVEDEIISILRIKPLYWSQFLCSFNAHCVIKNGIISFSHRYISEAVTDRYLQNKLDIENYRNGLACYFAVDESTRAWEELTYQYYKLNDVASLTCVLKNIDIVTHMIQKCEYETVSYIRLLMEKGFNPNVYQGLLQESETGKKAYSSFISFFVKYFSLYDLGLLLCQDFQTILEKEKDKVSQEESEEKLYIWKGIINRSLANYSPAIDAFEKAYQICAAKYGEVHVYTSHALKHIGTIYNELRNYDKAEEYYKKALCIQENLNATRERIDTIHSIADNCLDKKDLDQAEKRLFEALKLAKELIGEDNDTISSIYNSIGALYDFTGNYEESLKYAELSIEMDKNIYGKFNINTAHSLHNIAGTYYAMGRIEDAESAYKEAIAIKTELLGEEHYETSISIAGLGNLYNSKGQYDKALECHCKYYESYKKTHGVKDSYLAVILSGIGTDYSNMEDYENALIKHKEAIAVLESCNEPIPSPYYNAVGNDLYCLDKYPEAIDIYTTAMSAPDIESNPFDKSILCNCIARSYACMREYTAAKPFFEEALEIREKMFSKDDPRVEQCRKNVNKVNEILSQK